MSRRFTFRNILIVIVALLTVAQGVSWYLLGKANQKIDDSNFANQLTLNELDSAMQQRALSPIPGADRLYLAELDLTLPLNTMTSSIRYGFNLMDKPEDGGEVRLTSALMTDHTMRVKSCSDMVRLKVEPKPNAYSPDQPLYATVQLADGRTLQVYASTTEECQAAWRAVSPQSIAKEFKEALPY